MKCSEDQKQVQRQSDQEQPSRLAQQTRQLGGEGRAFARYGQELVPVPRYSGSRMVSRSTMVEPRISM